MVLVGDVPWPAGVEGRPAMNEHDAVRKVLRRAAVERARAIKEYQDAIVMAHNEGWMNTEIARVCGVTEGAIRLYLKRSGVVRTTR